jgi:DNA end-binding protein Ku
MISFGLINFPVRLYAAAREKTLNFDYLRRRDLCPVRYARVCRSTGEEVAYREIVRGYQYRKGDYVVLEDKDFKSANVKKSRTIEVVDFAPLSEIDVMLFEKPFYVEPQKEAKKVYALFREALRRSGRVGVARFVLRTREHMGILKAEGEAIVLDQMRFGSELLSPKGLDLPGSGELSEREIELALRLIESLSEPFDPGKFRDTYTDELKWIIEDKARGKAVQPREEKPEATEVSDLLARLKESLEYAHRK